MRTTLKYLEFEPVQWNPDALLIFCPAMDDPDCKKMSIARGIAKELPMLEEYAKEQGKKVIFTRFSIYHPHIMRFISKLGGNPFVIDLKTNEIWFSKPLNKES